MDIFGILTMVGGLALFLYGMNTMGDGLSGDSILVRNNCYGSWFR